MSKEPPKYIYLQKHTFEDEWDFDNMEGVTWSTESIQESNEIRYILEQDYLAVSEDLQEENRRLKEYCQQIEKINDRLFELSDKQAWGVITKEIIKPLKDKGNKQK
jgi:hypothetical protein